MSNQNSKILLSSPSGSIVGGISRWTSHILDYHHSNKTNIELFQFYPDGKGAYQNTPKMLRLWIGLSSYLPYLIKLRRVIRKTNVDVVHLVSSASLGLIRDICSLTIAKGLKKKVIIHFRFGRIPELFIKRNWEYKLLSYVLKNADKVLVIDIASYSTLEQFGYNNIELVPNPLSPIVSSIIKENRFIERDDHKILFAGHVVKTKGVYELIHACKSISDIRLMLIGHVSDEVKDDLIALAGPGSSKWLTIAGEVDFETTIKEMLSAGVFALPTYTEGFPNVIIESMACGCPIVTTNVGAIPEMLDIGNGENFGICIEPKNVDQLKDAITKMLNEKEYARNCGMNAQKRVNELYSMPIVWTQLENIWKSLKQTGN